MARWKATSKGFPTGHLQRQSEVVEVDLEQHKVGMEVGEIWKWETPPVLNTVRSQGKLEALHDQSKKTIGNLESRLGKAKATLRHKLDGHRVERDGDIGMGTVQPTVPLHNTDNDDGASRQAPKPDVDMSGAAPMPTPSPMGAMSTSKPGTKQKPSQRIARPKSSMEVDSVSPHPVTSLANGQVQRPWHNRVIVKLVSVTLITNSPLR